MATSLNPTRMGAQASANRSFGNSVAAQQRKKPLRFRYLRTGGKQTEVTLVEWEEEGAYVRGRPEGSDQWQEFLKLRIWKWRDDSYLQLKSCVPRAGAPSGARGKAVPLILARAYGRVRELLHRLITARAPLS